MDAAALNSDRPAFIVGVPAAFLAPAEWATNFQAIGGTWHIKPAGHFSVSWEIAGRGDDDRQAACALVARLTDDDDFKAAVLDHLCELEATPAAGRRAQTREW